MSMYQALVRWLMNTRYIRGVHLTMNITVRLTSQFKLANLYIYTCIFVLGSALCSAVYGKHAVTKSYVIIMILLHLFADVSCPCIGESSCVFYILINRTLQGDIHSSFIRGIGNRGQPKIITNRGDSEQIL